MKDVPKFEEIARPCLGRSNVSTESRILAQRKFLQTAMPHCALVPRPSSLFDDIPYPRNESRIQICPRQKVRARHISSMMGHSLDICDFLAFNYHGANHEGLHCTNPVSANDILPGEKGLFEKPSHLVPPKVCRRFRCRLFRPDDTVILFH